jgi:hypothetical protein
VHQADDTEGYLGAARRSSTALTHRPRPAITAYSPRSAPGFLPCALATTACPRPLVIRNRCGMARAGA